MSKSAERAYFKSVGKAGLEFTLAKPFSDPVNVGSLLSDIGAVFTLLPPPPARLLDLGCGSGWTSHFFAIADYNVTGVDISSDAIKAAKKTFTRPGIKLQYRCADYDKLNYENKFDVAVFFDSLHHSDNELDGITAAYRALKPGGIIIICEPGAGHSKSPSSLAAIATYGVTERDLPPKLTTKSLRRLGFKNIKTYAYPALVHRASYKAFRGKRKVFNHTIARGATSLALSTILKRSHGLVVAQKPPI